jgi:hypothetical protein
MRVRLARQRPGSAHELVARCLTGLVGRLTYRIGISRTVNRLPQTESRYVVLIALTAERIPAALLATVGADRSTTVGALRHSKLSAWHPNVVISEFNLAEWAHGRPLGLFGIAVRGIAFEPRSSSKWIVAREIGKRWQITTLNFRSLLHPGRTVLKLLTNRPAACEVPRLDLP